jgi:hypothetical protein
MTNPFFREEINSYKILWFEPNFALRFKESLYFKQRLLNIVNKGWLN